MIGRWTAKYGCLLDVRGPSGETIAAKYRLAREADDIFTMFTLLDENKLVEKLPRYVADGPDSILKF